MKNKATKVLSVQGNHHAVGFAIGKNFRKEIHNLTQYNRRSLKEAWRGKSRLLKKGLLYSMEICQRVFPKYMEELKGIADGSLHSFRELFLLNFIELNEMGADGDAKTNFQKCSTVAVPKQGYHLVGHNEDWHKKQNDIFVLAAKFPDGKSFMAITYFGYLPGMSAGFNAHGLFHAVNYLSPRDRQFGIPRTFITRAMLDAENFEQCKKIACLQKRSFGQSVNLFQKGKYLNIELSARRMACAYPQGVSIHTNHYLHPQMIKMEGKGNLYWSGNRLKTGEGYLKQKLKSNDGLKFFSEKEIRNILGMRNGAPYCFYCEPTDTGRTEVTLATILFDTRKAALRVIRGNPKRHHGELIEACKK